MLHPIKSSSSREKCYFSKRKILRQIFIVIVHFHMMYTEKSFRVGMFTCWNDVLKEKICESTIYYFWECFSNVISVGKKKTRVDVYFWFGSIFKVHGNLTKYGNILRYYLTSQCIFFSFEPKIKVNQLRITYVSCYFI